MQRTILVCALVALASSVGTAQSVFCSERTVRGVYAGTHSGMTTVPTTIPGGPTLPPFAFEMVSWNSFDGRGNGSGTITANFFGIVSKGKYSNFTYQVNSDCTVRMTFTVESPAVPGLLPAMVTGPNQHEGVVTMDGDEIHLVSVAATADGQGQVQQMARTTLKRVWLGWVP
jgi:hypothetical protein